MKGNRLYYYHGGNLGKSQFKYKRIEAADTTVNNIYVYAYTNVI